MKITYRGKLLFSAIVVFIVIVSYVYYARTESITSWKSPRLLTIEKEWQALYASISDTQDKSEYSDGVRMLNNLFKERLSKEDLCRLANTCGTLPVCESDQTEFQRDLLVYLAMAFGDAGDRDSLVKLLSTRFISHVAFNCYIEWYLLDCEKRMKDPILILGEAYSKSHNPKVRRYIAFVVRRAFSGSGIQGVDDTKFVQNAMSWYEKEKSHLVRNDWNYPRALYRPLYDPDNPYFKDWKYDNIPPLFVDPSTLIEWKKAEQEKRKKSHHN